MATMSDFTDLLRDTLRTAPPHALSDELVQSCIDSHAKRARTADAQFRRALSVGLPAIARQHRVAGLNGATGHITESVVESLLVDCGWTPVEQFEGPFSGGHGIDLGMLAPGLESLFAVEVKGTLQPTRWPGLRRGEVHQMSPQWLAHDDNPGVGSMGVSGSDLNVLVVVVQFARRQWKAVLSNDLVTVHTVADVEDLSDLSWLSL